MFNMNHGMRPGPSMGSPMMGSPMMGSPMMGSPMGSPMMGMQMLLMMQMMEMMQMLLGMLMGGGYPMSQMPGFGGGGMSPMGGSPLGSFLGGGGGGGGAAPQALASPAASGPALPNDGSVSPQAKNFMDIAKAQTGKPYVFGAQGPSAFDCSGLVHYALNKAGVKGGRLTARGYQAKYAKQAVNREQLKPGDLVFFHSKNDRGIPAGKATHIEIYLGNGMTMGTDSPKEGARVEPINWNTFIGGARVPELQ